MWTRALYVMDWWNVKFSNHNHRRRTLLMCLLACSLMRTCLQTVMWLSITIFAFFAVGWSLRGCNGFEVGNIDAIESHRQRLTSHDEWNLKKFAHGATTWRQTHKNRDLSWKMWHAIIINVLHVSFVCLLCKFFLLSHSVPALLLLSFSLICCFFFTLPVGWHFHLVDDDDSISGSNSANVNGDER